MRNVLVICFNRPDHAQRLFASIRAARPDFLYIAADGPRPAVAGEIERCDAVRDVFEGVDWPCHVVRDYAQQNMGCSARVVSAYVRTFEEVDKAIILEDDVIVHPSFFAYCDTLLDRFESVDRVRSISGSSHVRSSRLGFRSYYFSRYPEMWGWAAFRRSMQGVNWSPDPAETAERLQKIIRRGVEPTRWRILLQMCQEGKLNTWDYQYIVSGILNDHLAITPRVPLSRNGGFGADSTHTAVADPFFTRPIVGMELPLQHPRTMRRAALRDELRSVGTLPPEFPLYVRARPYAQEIRRRLLREGADHFEAPAERGN